MAATLSIMPISCEELWKWDLHGLSEEAIFSSKLFKNSQLSKSSRQLVNVNMFISQLGFCCVYFVFMADNLEDFFNNNTSIHLSKAVWMLLLLIPMLLICSIRRLSILAPFAMGANVVYVAAVAIVLFFFLSGKLSLKSEPRHSILQTSVLFPLCHGSEKPRIFHFSLEQSCSLLKVSQW